MKQSLSSVIDECLDEGYREFDECSDDYKLELIKASIRETSSLDYEAVLSDAFCEYQDSGSTDILYAALSNLNDADKINDLMNHIILVLGKWFKSNINLDFMCQLASRAPRPSFEIMANNSNEYYQY